MNGKANRAGVAPAWVSLACALGLHVADEAVNGFLPVWNATVTGLKANVPWLPLPAFPYWLWLSGLILAVAAMLVATPWIRRGTKWARRVAWFLAIVMVGNAFGHAAGTAFGRTIATVRFDGPMPGVYSSPVLLAAAAYLIVRLRGSRGTAPTNPNFDIA